MTKKGKDKKLNTSQVLKKANHINHSTSTTSPTKNKIKKIKIIHDILSFIILVLLGFIFAKGVPFFEKMVLENENWAVATIALPIAFLGIYISTLLPTFEKYNSLFASVELNKFYSYSYHPFDFSYLFIIQILYKFLVWVIAYFSNSYATMIACSLWICFELVYLILFTMWKYRIQPHKIYIKYILYTFWREFGKSKKSEVCTNSILPLLKKGELKQCQGIVEEKYFGFFRTINELSALIISKPECKQERLAFLSLCEKFESLEPNETCLLITLSFSQKATIIYDFALSEKEYDFAFALANKTINITASQIIKCCNYLSKNSEEMGVVLNNVSEKFTIKDIKMIGEIPSQIDERGYNFMSILLFFEKTVNHIIETAENHEVMNNLRAHSKTWGELRSEYIEIFDGLSKAKEMFSVNLNNKEEKVEI